MTTEMIRNLAVNQRKSSQSGIGLGCSPDCSGEFSLLVKMPPSSSSY